MAEQAQLRDAATGATQVAQWIAKQERDDLRLIPPLAEEFEVYGGDGTVERARDWALDGRYVLAVGVPGCAHGLYLMASCPGSTCCRNNFSQLDHVNLWIPAPEHARTQRPFLLSHPYADEIRDSTRLYAAAHGLDMESYPEFGDDWYGHGTVPIRLTIPRDGPLWPVEAKAAVLFRTQPVAWPPLPGPSPSCSRYTEAS